MGMCWEGFKQVRNIWFVKVMTILVAAGRRNLRWQKRAKEEQGKVAERGDDGTRTMMVEVMSSGRVRRV